MAAERSTMRDDEPMTGRIVEHDRTGESYVDGGGPGVGAVIIGLVLLALAAVVVVFLLSARRDDALRTDAVTSAAPSQAETTARTDQDVATLGKEAAASLKPVR